MDWSRHQIEMLVYPGGVRFLCFRNRLGRDLLGEQLAGRRECR